MTRVFGKHDDIVNDAGEGGHDDDGTGKEKGWKAIEETGEQDIAAVRAQEQQSERAPVGIS
jgi:hypothetical protein